MGSRRGRVRRAFSVPLPRQLISCSAYRVTPAPVSLAGATIAPERVVVVPNTVAEIFTLGDSQELRAAWGIEGKRVLLTVGRMVSCEGYKGHEHVIAAIPDLVRRGHDVVYLIIGEGDDRARLEEIARKIGVAERVRFLGAVD